MPIPNFIWPRVSGEKKENIVKGMATLEEENVQELDTQEDEEEMTTDEARIEMSGFALMYAVVGHLCRTIASMRWGQIVVGKIESVLKVIEDTARWSLPNADADYKLERPLPWPFFLILLVWMRIVRIYLSLYCFLMEKPLITPHDIIYFLQTQRRRLRAIRYHGLKVLRNQELEDAATNEREANAGNTFMETVRKFFFQAFCSPIQLNQAREDSEDDTALITVTDSPSSKREHEDSNLCTTELLDKYANEEESDDPDYCPNSEALGDSSSTYTQESSYGDTEVEVLDKEDLECESLPYFEAAAENEDTEDQQNENNQEAESESSTECIESKNIRKKTVEEDIVEVVTDFTREFNCCAKNEKNLNQKEDALNTNYNILKDYLKDYSSSSSNTNRQEDDDNDDSKSKVADKDTPKGTKELLAATKVKSTFWKKMPLDSKERIVYKRIHEIGEKPVMSHKETHEANKEMKEKPMALNETRVATKETKETQATTNEIKESQATNKVIPMVHIETPIAAFSTKYNQPLFPNETKDIRKTPTASTEVASAKPLTNSSKSQLIPEGNQKESTSSHGHESEAAKTKSPLNTTACKRGSENDIYTITELSVEPIPKTTPTTTTAATTSPTSTSKKSPLSQKENLPIGSAGANQKKKRHAPSPKK